MKAKEEALAGGLTEKSYWGGVHGRPPGGSPAGRLKEHLRGLLSRRRLSWLGSYADHLLWDVLYPTFLPKGKGLRALEVGCAPGRYLVRLRRVFGFEPFGVEYTAEGAEAARRLFVAEGLPPENILQEDFFSEDFARRHRSAFDVVISRGFIEHFADPADAVRRHADLLKEGGCLVVSIPCLRGMNYGLSRLFHKETLDMHNLDIMRKEPFAALFGGMGLAPLFCGYYGTFDFSLFNTKPGSPLGGLLAFCKGIQLLLNPAFRLLFGDRGRETPFFSPYLLFIGTKRGPAS